MLDFLENYELKKTVDDSSKKTCFIEVFNKFKKIQWGFFVYERKS